MITEYSKKKLIDYLRPNTDVLILFNDHGLGDVVMFMPLYERLKQMFPDVHFNLKCNNGQEFFEEIDRNSYNETFYIKFFEFYRWTDIIQNGRLQKVCITVNESKPEICCNRELGIPFEPSLEYTWQLNKTVHTDIVIPDKTIGVAFQVTSAQYKNIPYDSAKIVWNTIKECGYTPLEVHFEHRLKSTNNTKYDFIDNTCRNYPASVENLIDVINKCNGFIGVNTGSFVMATCLKQGKTLHMMKIFPFAPGYKRFNPVPEIDCRQSNFIDKNKIEQYLESLK